MQRKQIKLSHNLKIPKGFIIVTQEKIWMDEKLILLWIKEIWVKHAKKMGATESILSLASFSAHTSDVVAVEFRHQSVHPVIIPGG